MMMNELLRWVPPALLEGVGGTADALLGEDQILASGTLEWIRARTTPCQPSKLCLAGAGPSCFYGADLAVTSNIIGNLPQQESSARDRRDRPEAEGSTTMEGRTGRTMLDKIWAQHVTARITDDTNLLHVDRHLLHDLG